MIFYKSGIWYSSIYLKPLDILNDNFIMDEHTINRLTNVIEIPLVKKSKSNSFFMESWLICSCKEDMRLPNLYPMIL